MLKAATAVAGRLVWLVGGTAISPCWQMGEHSEPPESPQSCWSPPNPPGSRGTRANIAGVPQNRLDARAAALPDDPQVYRIRSPRADGPWHESPSGQLLCRRTPRLRRESSWLVQPLPDRWDF